MKTQAIEKLKKELKNARQDGFAEPIIEYLIGRCEEDSGICEDVLQEHKTWDRCFEYVYKQAKDFAKGKQQCAVRDDVVFEWAEDYYRLDDKKQIEEEEKERLERAKATEERKKQEAKAKKKREEAKKEIPETPKVETTPIKKGKDCDGQMDLFSMLGM